MTKLRRSFSLFAGFAVAAVVIPGLPVTAQADVTSWDAAGDFSSTANPSGAWSYGWEPARGGAFSVDPVATTLAGLIVWSATGTPLEPDVFFNGTGAEINPNGTNPIPAGTVGYHPGPAGQNAVVRWTAPTTGIFNVTATFTGRDNTGPTTTDVAVLANGNQLFGAEVTGFLSTQSFVGGPLNLNAGDTIDFTVGFGTDGNYLFDSTGLSAHITRLVDTTPPSITITTPAGGATYLLNQAAPADYACIDPDDTAAVSCLGSVTAGSAIDTASVGTKTFSVHGTDSANNQATASVSYKVGYGICVFNDQTRAVNSGATLPIKLTLCDAAGVNESSPDIALTAVSVIAVSTTGVPGTPDSPGNSQPDNNFRFDPDLAPGGGYHFNLSTDGLSTGTYVLNFTAAGDPTTHSALFEVR